ncbi:MAG: 3-deoxy-7-phosphoheptulonate synthase [Firmicutes bacterium]|nr:3-deoxy-7-phosphoheptulonate synthase [Bacillota bacterium]
MIVVMAPRATPEEIAAVREKLEKFGFEMHLSQGVERTILGAVGGKRPPETAALEVMAGVEKVVRILQPFKLVSKEFKSEPTVIKVRNLEIGNSRVVVGAGPCVVENRDQLLEVARRVQAAGANLLRGGAFKPRTSPYSFQGLGEEGLKLLAEAREETGLGIVTEVMEPGQVELVAEYTDILQLGARNMQNFNLLKALGAVRKPVLLKRGLSGTIQEWLMAAEYILSGGNYEVILCERGIRTFETATRNTLDLSAVPVAKQLSHLPVMVDPSHGTGDWKLVAPMSKAAVAAGADGILIEVHPRPEEALSDGPQSLTPGRFDNLMDELRSVAAAVGRQI